MDIVLRAIVLFFFVFLLLRVIGRRELSQLAPFDLFLLIVLGDAIQQGLTQDDYSVTGAVIAVSTLAALQVLTSFASFKLPFLRNVFEGEPVVIVQEGKPIYKNLKRERMTMDEVMEEARLQQQIVSVEDIGFAILEPSGNISFIPKKSS
jgi:uncharacterized membrane protein YcaP (DUF421 family)